MPSLKMCRRDNLVHNVRVSCRECDPYERYMACASKEIEVEIVIRVLVIQSVSSIVPASTQRCTNYAISTLKQQQTLLQPPPFVRPSLLSFVAAQSSSNLQKCFALSFLFREPHQ